MGFRENMSPEPASSLFADRPIRPLPKRRLRERLPPDVASSITYPPAPQSSTPLFVYPYSPRAGASPASTDFAGASSRDNVLKQGGDAGFRRTGLVAGQRDAETLMGQARRTLGSRGLHDPVERGFRIPSRSSNTRQPKAQPPPSTSSSMDGYESFENTNNKKKRKIPIAGESVLNGAHVVAEPAAFGLPSPSLNGDDDNGEHVPTSTPYYQSGGLLSNAQGISGPGRGRYGRLRNGRSPLRTLSDSNSNWSGRNVKLRSPNGYPSPPAETSGIISTAIASAEKLPLSTGQENISLLQQSTPSKPSPRASTQFTFTFGSQTPISWPGSDPAPHNTAGSNRTRQAVNGNGYHGTSTRGTQTQPGMPNLSAPGSSQSGMHASNDHSAKGEANAASTAKKSKRQGNVLLRAARQRRREAEYQNMHHPPAPEDYYLCEFCEYELIFGHPPEALIRQYEIKDRRRRREEAERRRLLEKAKMKSRKGKKSTNNKTTAKNNAMADRSSVAAQDTRHPPAVAHSHEPEEGEDFLSEAFDSEDSYQDYLPREHETPPLEPGMSRAQSASRTLVGFAAKSGQGGPLKVA